MKANKNNKYLIDGVEYRQEDIDLFRYGRQTSNRVKILEIYDKMIAGEIKNPLEAENEYSEFKIMNSVWENDEGELVEGRPETLNLKRIKQINVDDYVKVFYRQFWNYANSGKNAIDPLDQLQEVVSRIVYAAWKLNIKIDDHRKTSELMGEVLKYHPHGNDTIEDSIKGVATDFKSQKATRILEGIGNFGSAPGDSGAAGRYTSISGTPLLRAMIKDFPYVDIVENETGVSEPLFIPTPIPFALINGASSIGTGKSNYIAERDAREIIAWIDVIRKRDWKSRVNGPSKVPNPISVTGCQAEYDANNYYIVYKANVHFRVDRDDITKKGKFDVITELPPTVSAAVAIQKLKDYVPSRLEKKIVDGSGKGKPTWIALPTGIIDPNGKDWFKLKLQYARKEQVLMWDKDYEVDGFKGTMVWTKIEELARKWFENREILLKRRFMDQISVLQKNNHKIDLIKIYVENKMNHWSVDQIEKFYVEHAKENGVHLTANDEIKIQKGDYEPITPEEQGRNDANTVLSTAARAFLPENLEANELTRQSNDEKIAELRKIIENIGDQIIKEAYEIIEEQEAFFSGS